MATKFVGRREDLARLDQELARVRKTGEGALITLRGRRRVGKSRLIEYWLEQRKLRHVFFSATASTPLKDLDLFRDGITSSNLPAAATVSGISFNRWQSALTLAATGATRSRPLVVVIDEFPYLLGRQGQEEVESGVQHAWDRTLEKQPVLLVLIGSDIRMMEALATHGRPLFGRPTREMVVQPLTPREFGDLLKLSPVDTIDAYLVVGGFPGIVTRWPAGVDMWSFLRDALADPESSLIVNGERILSAEFPADLQARTILRAIGTGETTFTNIQRVAGVPQATVDRSLRLLTTTKRIVLAPTPVSTKPSDEKRYVVADPYLRFWLRFIEPALPEIERGRSDLVLDTIRVGWRTYRGRAVEPLVREAVTRMLPDPQLGDARHVGGYWTRKNIPEVDLVGVPGPKPKRVSFIGSIKWRDDSPFNEHDVRELSSLLPAVPGTDAETLLVAVARSRIDAKGLNVRLLPEDLIGAWR